MIQRISKSWKQQKSESTRQKNSALNAAGSKKFKTSILRSTNEDPAKKSKIKQLPEKAIKRKSSTNKQQCEITLDWGGSDSLFAGEDGIASQFEFGDKNQKENNDENQKNREQFDPQQSQHTQKQNKQQQPKKCQNQKQTTLQDDIQKQDELNTSTNNKPKIPAQKKIIKVMTRNTTAAPQIKNRDGESRQYFSPVLQNPPLRQSSPKGNTPDNQLESTNLNISQWGLPKTIEMNYKAKGIKTMFQWQKDCLLKGDVLDGGNLIYSAPTSGGKTLVAEILMLKRVLETKKKAIYILPFISVAREKMYALRKQFEETGINVGGFMGNETPAGGFGLIDVAICTIERANSIINRLMEEGNLYLLGCVVIDELHMIGDSSRGYLLELLLTKIRFISCRNSLNNSNPDVSIQLIGMSATLPNLHMLAEWLGAVYYFTDYRPVPLSEHLKVGRVMYDSEGKVVAEMPNDLVFKRDQDNITGLCLQTIREKNSILIFCPSKNWCEKLALNIATHILEHIINSENSTTDKAIWDNDALDDVLEQLKQTPAGLDSTLENMVTAGIAFHHAGLTMDERDIIEGAFRRGIIKVVVATSTLSSGVNLPARRVIIRSVMFHGKTIDPLLYKQMVGRAGRKGVDTKGESILVCKSTEKQKALKLLAEEVKPVYSCLLDETRSMKRALLEVIAGGVAVSPCDVELYAKSTFLNTCLTVQTDRNPSELITNAMMFLLKNDFIKIERSKTEEEEKPRESYHPSQLGTATLASSMKPDDALIVYQELQKARRNFCLESELHIIYQVTPTSISDVWTDLDWGLYYNIWERLPAQSKRVSELVGVQESFLARAMQNMINSTTEQQKQRIRIHRRFFAALILHDLVNEEPLSVVSGRYKVHKGWLQSLQNSSATFAGMITVFCRKLRWNCMEVLLEQFQSRLSFGVCRELCNLVRIPLLNRFTARLFFKHGYETVSAIANSSKNEIANILRESSTPFHSDKISGNETVGRKSNVRHIWLTGLEGLTEQKASEMVIEEAKRIVTADAQALGIPVGKTDISFNKNKSKKEKSSPKANAGNANVGNSKRRRKRSSTDKVIEIRSKKFSPNRSKSEGVLAENKKNCDAQRDCDRMTIEPTIKSVEKRMLQSECSKTKQNLQRNVEQTNLSVETGKSVHESSDSSVISDSLFNSPERPCCGPASEGENSQLSFSLRLSTTDEITDQPIVPPLKLYSQFNAADSGFEKVSSKLPKFQSKAVEEKGISNNSNTSIEALLFSSYNSNDLFESSEARLNEPTSPSTNMSNVSTENSSEFLIIDVASSKSLFLTFLQEWTEKESFSICFSCEATKSSGHDIGNKLRTNIAKDPHSFVNPTRLLYTTEDIYVTGLAVCWGQKDAYFVDLLEKTANNSLDDTSLPPDVSDELSLSFRLKSVRSVLNKKCQKDIFCFDIKEQLKIIFELTNFLLPASSLSDPKVAQWLLEPGQCEKNLHGIVKQWLPEEFIALTEGIGGGFGSRGYGIVPKQGCSGRIRACVEVVLVHELMKRMKEKLLEGNLYLPFRDIEMPTLRTLAAIEINGMGFSEETCEKLKAIMKKKLEALEDSCYHLAKRTFSLSSSYDVGRLLYVDLALPHEGNTDLSRNTRNKTKQHFRTSKDALEKLVKYHSLPGLIIEWRHINSALTKVVYPVQRKKCYIQRFAMHRIFCETQFHTTTGRVTFSEPNIQNVHKEFDVKICTENGREEHQNGLCESPRQVHAISVRSMFVPFKGGVFISADYSQLELRIMAHLSSDLKLLKSINTSSDIFKSIASQINRVCINDVTTLQRQQAKQICYGILYGIGIKSLAEKLGTCEEEASVYMENFKAKYIGVNLFIKRTVEKCRSKGYVETMSGRKRYLPAITSNNPYAKAQAERQAVNTAVQGSAADLVKAAMVKIDANLFEKFGNSCLKRTDAAFKQRGAFLVLQLHDELLYETNRKDVDDVLEIIKGGMENAYQLSVETPVKIHVGANWGILKNS